MEASIEQIKDFLSIPKTFAVFGASTKSEKAGNYVPKFLLDRGFSIIPINPFVEEIIDIPTIKDLESLHQDVDALIIYRNSNDATEVIKKAVTMQNIKWIWLPEKVISEEGRKLAIEAGKMYVEDRCPKALLEQWEKTD